MTYSHGETDEASLCPRARPPGLEKQCATDKNRRFSESERSGYVRAKTQVLSRAESKTPTSGSTGITQERPDWSARGRPQRAPCSVPSEATERGWRLRHREGDKYRCAACWAARDGRRTTASASRRRQRRDGGRNIWAAGAARGVRSAGEGRINGSDGTNWAGVGITSHAAICVMVTGGRVFEHALAGVGVW